MTDITDIMNDFRECVRHLWNTHFLRALERDDWNFVDLFNGIEMDLFRVLVLRKLDREEWLLTPAQWRPEEVLTFLKVDAHARSPIMINRAQDSSGWDDPVDSFWKGELDLRFLHYFDWNVTGFRDFTNYRVRIVGSEKHPHLVGRNALVPVGAGVSVFHDEGIPKMGA